MKIDTSSPRIPLHRLKHPVKEPHLAKGKVGVDAKVDSDAFERELTQEGARKFKEWLEKLEVK